MNKKYLALFLLIGLVGCTNPIDSSKESISSIVEVSFTSEDSNVEISSSNIENSVVSSSSTKVENNNNNNSLEISSGTGWLPPI